jgi:hypothetical protein
MRDPGTLSSWMWQALAAIAVASCLIFLVAAHFLLGAPEAGLLVPAILQVPVAAAASPLIHWGLSREFKSRGDIKPMYLGICIWAMAENWILNHFGAHVGLVSSPDAHVRAIIGFIAVPPAALLLYWLDPRVFRPLRARCRR